MKKSRLLLATFFLFGLLLHSAYSGSPLREGSMGHSAKILADDDSTGSSLTPPEIHHITIPDEDKPEDASAVRSRVPSREDGQEVVQAKNKKSVDVTGTSASAGTSQHYQESDKKTGEDKDNTSKTTLTMTDNHLNMGSSELNIDDKEDSSKDYSDKSSLSVDQTSATVTDDLDTVENKPNDFFKEGKRGRVSYTVNTDTKKDVKHTTDKEIFHGKVPPPPPILVEKPKKTDDILDFGNNFFDGSELPNPFDKPADTQPTTDGSEKYDDIHRKSIHGGTGGAVYDISQHIKKQDQEKQTDDAFDLDQHFDQSGAHMDFRAVDVEKVATPTLNKGSSEKKAASSDENNLHYKKNSSVVTSDPNQFMSDKKVETIAVSSSEDTLKDSSHTYKDEIIPLATTLIKEQHHPATANLDDSFDRINGTNTSSSYNKDNKYIIHDENNEVDIDFSGVSNLSTHDAHLKGKHATKKASEEKGHFLDDSERTEFYGDDDTYDVYNAENSTVSNPNIYRHETTQTKVYYSTKDNGFSSDSHKNEIIGDHQISDSTFKNVFGSHGDNDFFHAPSSNNNNDQSEEDGGAEVIDHDAHHKIDGGIHHAKSQIGHHEVTNDTEHGTFNDTNVFSAFADDSEGAKGFNRVHDHNATSNKVVDVSDNNDFDQSKQNAGFSTGFDQTYFDAGLFTQQDKHDNFKTQSNNIYYNDRKHKFNEKEDDKILWAPEPYDNNNQIQSNYNDDNRMDVSDYPQQNTERHFHLKETDHVGQGGYDQHNVVDNDNGHYDDVDRNRYNSYTTNSQGTYHQDSYGQDPERQRSKEAHQQFNYDDQNSHAKGDRYQSRNDQTPGDNLQSTHTTNYNSNNRNFQSENNVQTTKSEPYEIVKETTTERVYYIRSDNHLQDEQHKREVITRGGDFFLDNQDPADTHVVYREDSARKEWLGDSYPENHAQTHYHTRQTGNTQYYSGQQVNHRLHDPKGVRGEDTTQQQYSVQTQNTESRLDRHEESRDPAQQRSRVVDAHGVYNDRNTHTVSDVHQTEDHYKPSSHLQSDSKTHYDGDNRNGNAQQTVRSYEDSPQRTVQSDTQQNAQYNSNRYHYEDSNERHEVIYPPRETLQSDNFDPYLQDDILIGNDAPNNVQGAVITQDEIETLEKQDQAQVNVEAKKEERGFLADDDDEIVTPPKPQIEEPQVKTPEVSSVMSNQISSVMNDQAKLTTGDEVLVQSDSSNHQDDEYDDFSDLPDDWSNIDVNDGNTRKKAEHHGNCSIDHDQPGVITINWSDADSEGFTQLAYLHDQCKEGGCCVVFNNVTNIYEEPVEHRNVKERIVKKYVKTPQKNGQTKWTSVDSHHNNQQPEYYWNGKEYVRYQDHNQGHTVRKIDPKAKSHVHYMSNN